MDINDPRFTKPLSFILSSLLMFLTSLVYRKN